jgi:LemA protein
MKNWLVILGVIGAAVLLLVMWFVGQYNNLVRLDQDVENKQAQVEVVLQRRFDLIPNLVNATKGIMEQEQEVFTAIAEARTKYGSAAAGSGEKIEAAGELEGALSRLLVIVENYPELKSDSAVIGLMDELAGSENRISTERQRYNDSVTTFNTRIKLFPTNLFASMFGFSEKPLFESAEGADTAPEVNL